MLPLQPHPHRSFHLARDTVRVTLIATFDPVVFQITPTKAAGSMRGVVVFDDRSDLAFYTLDREMEEYVVRRITELDVEAGAPVSGWGQGAGFIWCECFVCVSSQRRWQAW